MGFCYTNNGLLCCDICGDHGSVRKVRCPFGYCQAIAGCPACRKHPEKKKYFSVAYHRDQGCEQYHNEFVAREKHRADLIAAGHAVRCSALSVDVNGESMVHVLFQNKTGTIGFYMDHATYDAFPLGEPMTPDDYRKHGQLAAAPSEFYTGSTTKELKDIPADWRIAG